MNTTLEYYLNKASEFMTRLTDTVWPEGPEGHARRRLTAGIALSLASLIMLGSAWLGWQYSYYSELVDAKLADRSFQQPAGLYAAPRRVSTGQYLTADELAERLLRAGYAETDKTTEYNMGNFKRTGSEFEIYTNGFARNEATPERMVVRFGKNSITEIQNLESLERLTSVLLPAEILTADSNVKNQTWRATTFEEIPETLVKAICATEDRRYFSHFGIDVFGILRAAWVNLSHGAIREGGSTLTQQLVKNEFLTSERTYKRKFAEALMAIALERRLTKQQIFALYAEHVYLGNTGITAVYGFRQAAHVFLGKELDELSVAEAAFLAGMIRSPNRYTTQAKADEAVVRRNVVLESMAETGYLSATQAARAKNEPLALAPPPAQEHVTAPYFVDYVRRELARHDIEPQDRSQMRVETTIDLDLQQAANEVVTQHRQRIEKLVAKKYPDAKPEVALVALDPKSGGIMAMVGGSDYAASQLNRVTDAHRQPGSAFKPIVYAAALEHGLSPATTFMNAPHDIEFGYKAVYHPDNFGNSYTNQPVTLRDALVRSLNVVTVDAAMQVGLGEVGLMAKKVGLPQPESYPSMALGAFEVTPLELASAYAVFANNGLKSKPTAIRSVKEKNDQVPAPESGAAQIMAPSVAYLVTDALTDVVNRGTASRIRQMGYRGPAAGKTGTSRDAWFAGYTPNLVVVVWVGFDDNRNLDLTGGEASAPVWADFMQRAGVLRPDLTARQFTQPGGLELVEIDLTTGHLAGAACPERQFILMAPGQMPTACYEHQTDSLVAETYLEMLPDGTYSVESRRAESQPNAVPASSRPNEAYPSVIIMGPNKPQNARRVFHIPPANLPTNPTNLPTNPANLPTNPPASPPDRR